MSLVSSIGLQKRLTIAATLAGVLGLAVGGILMVNVLERSLLAAVDDSARSNARDIAILVDNDRLTDPLPSYGAAVAQVVDGEGNVIASTPGGDRLNPIVSKDQLATVRDGTAIDLDGSRLGQPDPYRVVGLEAGLERDPDNPQIILVAVSAAQTESSARIVRTGVAVGSVALTVGLGLLSWFLIGRSLRPVERLRSGAADISGTGRLDRLPLPDANDEIHRLAVTLNDMLGRLETASIRQRAFVSDAAHELRSPIAAVRTQLEVALAHPDAIDPLDTAREALDELERLRRLVDDLLVLARIDERGQAIGQDSVDLRQLVLGVSERLSDARVPIFVPAGGPVTVKGNERALARVVWNLLDNAVRHADAIVTVRLGRYARSAELIVEDDGPGVPEADRERIFERFTRLDDARARDEGGTGLGLAIVREIVNAHKGSVRVDSAKPGARFLVHLPLAPISPARYESPVEQVGKPNS